MVQHANQPPVRVSSSYAGFLAVPSGDPYLRPLKGEETFGFHTPFPVSPKNEMEAGRARQERKKLGKIFS